ncbi:MAG: serine hydrolase domain-containing protein, partial [Myxococcota bacterium]
MATSDHTKELSGLLDDAVASGATPAFCGIVGTLDEGGPRFVYAGGRTHRDHGAPAVDESTVFDLASLTKVLATALLCAEAVHEGKINLDETPWPAWPGVRIRHILAHEGGLPAWAPFFTQVPRLEVGLPAGATHVLRQVFASAPERPPGEGTRYSDLGFIALGALLEERLGARLDQLFEKTAGEAYGAHGLRFVPLYEDGYHPSVPWVAATTRCGWRGRVIQGQVDDENAFAMGGVAGHAGLVGPGFAVERAARALRDRWEARGAL